MSGLFAFGMQTTIAFFQAVGKYCSRIMALVVQVRAVMNLFGSILSVLFPIPSCPGD